MDYALYGPDITAGALAALRPGELVGLTDDGGYEARTTTEADWRADACDTSEP